MQMHVMLLSLIIMYLNKYVKSFRLRLILFVRYIITFKNITNYVINLRKRIILKLKEVVALLI